MGRVGGCTARSFTNAPLRWETVIQERAYLRESGGCSREELVWAKMTCSLTPGATLRWGPPVKQFKIEVALAFTSEKKHWSIKQFQKGLTNDRVEEAGFNLIPVKQLFGEARPPPSLNSSGPKWLEVLASLSRKIASRTGYLQPLPIKWCRTVSTQPIRNRAEFTTSYPEVGGG